MKLKLNLKTGIIIYFLLLAWLYHYKIKHYYYWGYVGILEGEVFGFSLVRLFVATLILLSNLYFISRIDRNKLSFIVISIFFVLLTIPSLIAFTSNDIYPIKLLIYHQTFFHSLYFLSKVKIDFKRIPVLNKKQSLYILLLITAIGSLPYIIIYGPHINFKNLLLIDVYSTRNIMNSLSNPYFGYTYSIFSKIIIPLIIVFSLELKNKLWTIVGIAYLILFYLFGAHKTIIVALFLVFVFYKFSYFGAVKKWVYLSNALIVLVICFALFGWDYPWILTFRRVHFLPTLLDICYLDFFEAKPIYWSESILKPFFDYPFSAKHANVIGEHYFKNPDMGANNGIISDGFMNFGSVGVMFNVFLVSGYFMVLNSLNIPSRYFGLFILIIFSFISSSTLTVFLTHGAFALLLISMFVLNEKKQ